MKVFEVSFTRKEFCRFKVKAKNKKEVKDIIDNCEWDSGEEKVDEIQNENFMIKEIDGN